MHLCIWASAGYILVINRPLGSIVKQQEPRPCHGCLLLNMFKELLHVGFTAREQQRKNVEHSSYMNNVPTRTLHRATKHKFLDMDDVLYYQDCRVGMDTKR